MAIKWYYPIHRAEAKEEKRISQSANDELANIMKSIEDIQNMPQPTKGKNRENPVWDKIMLKEDFWLREMGLE